MYMYMHVPVRVHWMYTQFIQNVNNVRYNYIDNVCHNNLLFMSTAKRENGYNERDKESSQTSQVKMLLAIHIHIHVHVRVTYM